MSDETIIVYQGATSPSLATQITVAKKTFDLTNYNVRFRMRQWDGSALVVDAAATVAVGTTGAVSYNFLAADTATVGNFMGWWHVSSKTTSENFDTPEFPITVDAHSPGVGIVTGAIASQMGAHLPMGVAGLRNDYRYGDVFLQRAVELIKYRLLQPADYQPAANENSFHPVVVDWLAKWACIEIGPAIREFWMVQYQTESVNTGSNVEMSSYPDRMKALDETLRQLRMQVENDRVFVMAFFPNLVEKRRGNFPSTSSPGPFVSDDPRMYPLPDSGGQGIGNGRGGWTW
jgi:hypothetical protein